MVIIINYIDLSEEYDVEVSNILVAYLNIYINENVFLKFMGQLK